MENRVVTLESELSRVTSTATAGREKRLALHRDLDRVAEGVANLERTSSADTDGTARRDQPTVEDEVSDFEDSGAQKDQIDA